MSTLCDPLSFPISQRLLKFMSIECPTISCSASLFSFCLQSFQASRYFPMNQFFTSGGQSIGASASASVLPMNIQGWFPVGLTGWISLLSKGLSRVFSNTTVQSINSLAFSLLYDLALQPYMTTGKTIGLSITDLCWQYEKEIYFHPIKAFVFSGLFVVAV